jgi:hypothetical protein
MTLLLALRYAFVPPVLWTAGVVNAEIDVIAP